MSGGLGVREVVAELLERRDGLWCPACAALCGVQMTFGRHDPDGTLRLVTVARCSQCRGPVREPSA